MPPPKDCIIDVYSSCRYTDASEEGRMFSIAGTRRELFLPFSIEAKVGQTITILGVECVIIGSRTLKPTGKPFPDSWFEEI